ncbi:MAG: hypothetical protein H7249_07340 [Chitinophagaceae bacterium]|nr:hypothetical protein [Oligoflexus sp.]
MKQVAIRFGRHADMIGVLALPSGPTLVVKRALLVWNTGISHRIGPQRMNVEIAQQLTAHGLPVFRFDLSGRGDSSATEGAIQSAVLDVQEAMDYLSAQYGYEEFILHGLCSGAIEAHYVAAADKRVVGLSMIDTYSYRVGNYYWHYLKKRICSKQAWTRLFRRFQGPKTSNQQQAIDQFFVPFPNIEILKTDYAAFAKRRMPCLVVFTNGYEHIFNYAGQFQDMLKGIDLTPILTLHHHSGADHLCTIIGQRERILDRLSLWIESNYLSPI